MAQRNLPIFQEENSTEGCSITYARTLQKMGAKPEQIMYYMRLGPSQFQALHKHITKKLLILKRLQMAQSLVKRLYKR